jgi:hypothetical protein
MRMPFALTLQNSEFCLQCIYLFYMIVRIRVNISVNNINRMFDIMRDKAFHGVGTEFENI